MNERRDQGGVNFLQVQSAAAAFFHGIEIPLVRQTVKKLTMYKPLTSDMRFDNTMKLSLAQMSFYEALRLMLELGWYGETIKDFPSDKTEFREIYGTFIFGTVYNGEFVIQRIEGDKDYPAYFVANTYFVTHHKDLMLELALMFFRSFSSVSYPSYESLIRNLVMKYLDVILYSKPSDITYTSSSGTMPVADFEIYRYYRIMDEKPGRLAGPHFLGNGALTKPKYIFHSRPLDDDGRRSDETKERLYIRPYSTITSHFIMKDGRLQLPNENDLQKVQFVLPGYSAAITSDHPDLIDMMCTHIKNQASHVTMNPFLIDKHMNAGRIRDQHYPGRAGTHIPYKPFNQITRTLYRDSVTVELDGICGSPGDTRSYHARDCVEKVKIGVMASPEFGKTNNRTYNDITGPHQRFFQTLYQQTQVIYVADTTHRPHTVKISFYYEGNPQTWNLLCGDQPLPNSKYVTNMEYRDVHSAFFNFFRHYEKTVHEIVVCAPPMAKIDQFCLGVHKPSVLCYDNNVNEERTEIMVSTNQGLISVSHRQTRQVRSEIKSHTSDFIATDLNIDDVLKFYNGIGEDISGEQISGEQIKNFLLKNHLLSISDEELISRGLLREAVPLFRRKIIDKLRRESHRPQINTRFSQSSDGSIGLIVGWTKLYRSHANADPSTKMIRESTINGKKFAPSYYRAKDVDILNIEAGSRTASGPVFGSLDTPTSLSPRDIEMKEVYNALYESLSLTGNENQVRVLKAKVKLIAAFSDEYASEELTNITLKQKVVSVQHYASLQQIRKLHRDRRFEPKFVERDVGPDGALRDSVTDVTDKIFGKSLQLITHHPQGTLYQPHNIMTLSNKLSSANKSRSIVPLFDSNVDLARNSTTTGIVYDNSTLFPNGVNGLNMVKTNETWRRQPCDPYSTFPTTMNVVRPLMGPGFVYNELSSFNLYGARTIVSRSQYSFRDTDLIDRVRKTRVNGVGFVTVNLETKSFKERKSGNPLSTLPPLMENKIHVSMTDVELDKEGPYLDLPEFPTMSVPYKLGNTVAPSLEANNNHNSTKINNNVVLIASNNLAIIHMVPLHQQFYCQECLTGIAKGPSEQQAIKVREKELFISDRPYQ
jgi:hypothetical protein